MVSLVEPPLMVSLACPEVLEGSNHWNDWNWLLHARGDHEVVHDLTLAHRE